MKKSSFKILCSSLFKCGLIIGPVVMMPITSCTNTNNNIISTITFNDISTNYKSKQEQNLSFQTRSFKCDDILYGNNSISNGNYVLFIASNTDHTP